ncbi:MAG TPA: site-specific integrase [Pedobacter sp.]|nr:site-specific integrase [Pedobacter sp.]
MMNEKNTLTINFYLKKTRVNKDGKSPVVARITLNGKRLEISTGKSVEDSRWNTAKGVAKGNKEDVARLNSFLSNFHAKIADVYEDMKARRLKMTIEQLRDIIDDNPASGNTLVALITYHNQTEGDHLEWGTMKNYMTSQKYLLAFVKKQFGTADLELSQLSFQFFNDFHQFLRKQKNRRGEIAMANNGIMKHLERFCKMVHLALKIGWIEKYPFTAHQPKFDKVERHCLDKDELNAIKSKALEINRLEIVRDLFVFSCYTGLAYIDVMSLNSSHMSIGVDGGRWIMCKRKKTSVPVKIPLLSVPAEIIEKYRHGPDQLYRDRLLPSYSNQKLNSYLKELADICGINKNLTFHTARHTFATTVTLSNGVPIETVSKMLGHSKISTTQIYAKVVEHKVSEDMAALRMKLEPGQGRVILYTTT